MVAVTADLIRAARTRIPAAFRDSPQLIAEALSERAGVPVIVKVESANPIGCFKGRGTWLAVAELIAHGAVGERRGLVVASAGNFGQGVAFAGRAMHVPVLVYAATTANTAKVAAMRRLAAEVRLVGGTSMPRARRRPRTRRGPAGVSSSTGRIPGSRSGPAASRSS
jgi:threonine dehydratase